MLDVSLQAVSFRVLRDLTTTFPASTHTALVGAGGGASTLLELLAGGRPERGEVRFGARVVNDVKAARRPVLRVTSELDVPGRWSVQHALVAAVRQRTLDRTDRHREYALAVGKWDLAGIVERRVRTLSSSEATLVQLARIELMLPGILLADRVLERLNPALLPRVADAFYRTLRVMGTTAISAPATVAELGLTDAVLVLDQGRVVQQGTPAEVYARPASEQAARATGDVNVVPLTIRGTVAEAAIGAWDLANAPFEGSGIALVRPEDFEVAGAGEDFDFTFAVEEAAFESGRWIARGMLTGGVVLRVALPQGAAVHKGKLIPIRYDATRFVLLARAGTPAQPTVPTDVIPPLRETR